jgi:hypothetical protein
MAGKKKNQHPWLHRTDRPERDHAGDRRGETGILYILIEDG